MASPLFSSVIPRELAVSFSVSLRVDAVKIADPSVNGKKMVGLKSRFPRLDLGAAKSVATTMRPHSLCGHSWRRSTLISEHVERCRCLLKIDGGFGNTFWPSRLPPLGIRRLPAGCTMLIHSQCPLSALSHIPECPALHRGVSSARACGFAALPLPCKQQVVNSLDDWLPPPLQVWWCSVQPRGNQVVMRCSVASSATVLDDGHENMLHPETREQEQEHEQDAFLRVAGIVGAATMASKLLGTVRETALAAAFGVGPVMDAFSYASLAPGFFVALLGGINGPFHSAMSASLSKRTRSEGAYLVGAVSTLVGVVFAGVSIIVAIFAEPIIDRSAPGLLLAHPSTGILTRNIAISQLRIMAPCALLAPLIGIGFGSLSARKVYVVPSLSPSFSSLAILLAVGVHVARFGKLAGHPSNAMQGGITLAIGSIGGTVLQWLVQVIAQAHSGGGFFRLRLGNPFRDPGVKEVLGVVVPAAVGSGLLQVATYTDLYFASFLPNAASGLGYANLLAQAPLGIISSAILVPVLPLFAKFSKPDRWPELRQQVRQGLLLTAASTLLMTAILIPLARPLVQLLFERRAFDAAASEFVSSLFVCYVSGSIVYLSRDVLVRVFYALGDGKPPFYTSIVAIISNAILDWLAVRRLAYGAQGLVLATLSVNFLSVVILLGMLSRKLQGLKMKEWARPFGVLACGAASTAVVTQAVYSSLLRLSAFVLAKGSMTRQIIPLILELMSLGIAATAGLLTFAAIVFSLRVQEIDSLLPSRLRQA